MQNEWPNRYRHAMDQSDHEAWNELHYPGTRQLCVECENPTGRCEEDSLFADEDGEIGPLCEKCWERRNRPCQGGSVMEVDSRDILTFQQAYNRLDIEKETLEKDCITLAMRLYGEDPSTFAPETAEVMDRWRPRCEAAFREATEAGNCIDCGGPVYNRPGKPGEYDHSCACNEEVQQCLKDI